MRKQTTISVEDIRYVSITCAYCKSRMIIDMGIAPALGTARPQFVPYSCGTCNEPFDSAVQNLNKFQPVYLALLQAALKNRLCFVTESEIT